MKQFLCTLCLSKRCDVEYSPRRHLLLQRGPAEFPTVPTGEWSARTVRRLTASDKSLVLVFNEIKTAPLKLLKEGPGGPKTATPATSNPVPTKRWTDS